MHATKTTCFLKELLILNVLFFSDIGYTNPLTHIAIILGDAEGWLFRPLRLVH